MMRIYMRPLFTDKWNSFWHVVFGMLAVRYYIIIPLFVAYQLMDWRDKNLFCDLLEFVVGYIMYAMIIHVCLKRNSNK